MNDREHAEDILETGRRDLRALRAMHDVEAFPDEIFGFHAQQAVEKAMKAWLARAECRPARWTRLSTSMPLPSSIDMRPSMRTRRPLIDPGWQTKSRHESTRSPLSFDADAVPHQE
jgi:hypothetical protein